MTDTPEIKQDTPVSLNDFRAIEDVKSEIITSICETLGKEFMKKSELDTTLANTLPASIHSYMGEYTRKMVKMSAEPLKIEQPQSEAEIVTDYLSSLGIIKK